MLMHQGFNLNDEIYMFVCVCVSWIQELMLICFLQRFKIKSWIIQVCFFLQLYCKSSFVNSHDSTSLNSHIDSAEHM